MTLTGAHRNFNIQLDKSTSISSYPSFLPEEVDYWLNTAIQRFIKTRYSGNNVLKEGFQQNQKRSDDLRSIVKTKQYTSTDIITRPRGVYSVEYPSDYWIGLGENASISFRNKVLGPDIVKSTDVLEATIENIDSKLRNSLSEHRLNKSNARPIRLYRDNKVYLYTDSNYTITDYTMTYIFKPALLNWYAGDKNAELTIMPDHTWDEIIMLAVGLAIENISDSRYQTFAQETQVIE